MTQVPLFYCTAPPPLLVSPSQIDRAGDPSTPSFEAPPPIPCHFFLGSAPPFIACVAAGESLFGSVSACLSSKIQFLELVTSPTLGPPGKVAGGVAVFFEWWGGVDILPLCLKLLLTPTYNHSPWCPSVPLRSRMSSHSLVCQVHVAPQPVSHHNYGSLFFLLFVLLRKNSSIGHLCNLLVLTAHFFSFSIGLPSPNLLRNPYYSLVPSCIQFITTT